MLSLVSALAIAWMYQFMGRAPQPTASELAWGSAQRASDLPARTITRPARITANHPPGAASAPGGQPSGWTGLVVGAAGSATAPQAQQAQQAPPSAFVTSPPQAQAPQPSGPNLASLTAQAGAAAGTPLPFVPGAEVLETSVEQPAGGAASGSSWSATLSSKQPLAQVAAFYRAQLKQLASGQNLSLTETSPTAGQLLIAVANTANGSHSAVWMGESDGQVTIRLLRTTPAGP